MKFDNMENLLRYCQDSICLVTDLKKDMSFIGFVSNKFTADGSAGVTDAQGNHVKFGMAKLWEFRSPPNGYVQTQNIVHYLTREPKRVWRVGLFKGNTYPAAAWDWGVLNLTKAVDTMYRRDWPVNIDHALAKIPNVPNNKSMQVLSARYALSKDKLFYRGEICGYLNNNAKEILFNSETEMTFHKNNLSSKLGSYHCKTKVQIKAPVLDLKDYKYDYDI